MAAVGCGSGVAGGTTTGVGGGAAGGGVAAEGGTAGGGAVAGAAGAAVAAIGGGVAVTGGTAATGGGAVTGGAAWGGGATAEGTASGGAATGGDVAGAGGDAAGAGAGAVAAPGIPERMANSSGESGLNSTISRPRARRKAPSGSRLTTRSVRFHRPSSVPPAVRITVCGSSVIVEGNPFSIDPGILTSPVNVVVIPSPNCGSTSSSAG
jgi:hypothetical protein